MRRTWIALAAAAWVGLGLAAIGAAPSSAATPPGLTLARVSEAAERRELPVLRQALADTALLASVEAVDPDAAVDLQLSIARVCESAGDRPAAIAAYRLAVAAIARAHGGHDDLAQVDPLRRIAALESQAGDLAAAFADIDKAFAIATNARHPSLAEVTQEYGALRAAYAAANPGLTLPEPYRPRAGAPTSKYDVLEVFYATHRRPTGSSEPTAFYGGDRGPLVFGKAYVSVPRDRPAGAIPRPDVWRLEFRPDPNRHVILTGVTPLGSREAFFSDVSARVAASHRKEVFVFIHGFNTSFEGGAERTAQMAADLNIDGAPILYSWPSKASILAYSRDEQEPLIDAQIDDLAQFLADVAQRTGAERVHLIAHSMGNRFLVRALTRLSQRPAEARPHFDEVVMAAPDVGVDDFHRVWPGLRPLGERFTLYASRRDKALILSGQIHQMQRVGDARRIVVTDGLQTVDTTAASQGLLGHTDFDGSALDDFRGVIWYSLAPDKRCVLETDRSGSATFWVFAGPKACREDEFRQAVSLARTAGSPQAALESVQSMMAQIANVPSAAGDLNLLEKVKGVLLVAFGQPEAAK